ncbi:hypothetical protein E2C01_005902 [Portunus trituberculatus]|uniref:Uncharacterized protein n=1 Tax=Portunus trituberculatus TaxID=210409 RepID=A0A5B7CUS5_PORTR|nr:hypothetical protein [Portunus trituberculatus]
MRISTLLIASGTHAALAVLRIIAARRNCVVKASGATVCVCTASCPTSSSSSSSSHDDLHLPNVKLEESGEEQTVYSSQPASHTDSPVPPRSDSGCEVLPGPYTPSQSPLLPRLHPHTHSPTHLYSPTQSPGPSRHVSGFSSPYSVKNL